jgi:PhoPQ-activated pathogenicity-related protein
MSRRVRWCATLLMATLLSGASTARGDLNLYVKRPDSAFTWKIEGQTVSALGTATRLTLTSQVWQGITWQHELEIYEPAQLTYRDAVLLYITGGNGSSHLTPEDAAQGFGLARLCGARCAVLHQVPNQPLLDGKSEDDLIAETFVRYLDTKDENWPLLFPMVKSAVRAMDAVQAWAQQDGRGAATRFVVSGASKRGWTTWLTAAVDPRVAAIAPLVIVTLNMRAQNPHQLEVWGKFSEQIEDYTKRGLTERLETPEGLKLWAMIDPYTYRDRLTMPKMLINGTNDRYWTLDALNLFWDDLKGPKWVVYVPNAGHGLDQNRDYATHGVGALFRSVVSNRPLPELDWKHDDAPSGDLRLTVSATPAPKTATVWVAHSDTLDFRDSPWTASAMLATGSTLTATVPRPAKGNVAFFGDLGYEIDGIPFHLSTLIRQTGVKLKK